MGCFGYICNGCHKSIMGGEVAVLKHIRHGVVLGETDGHYDSYGRVDEDSIYRNHDAKNPNSHVAICDSEFMFTDSEGYSAKLYDGNPIKWMDFRQIKGMDDLSSEMYAEWDSLPDYTMSKIKSGTEAWHKYCYDRASNEQKNEHIISKGDPNQSFGTPRKQYM